MSNATENPIILDISSSYGALLVGSLLSCVIWGMSCMQTFLYFMNYESDSWYMKILVMTLWCLDTSNEILCIKSLWPVLVLNYGKIEGLKIIQKELMHHVWVVGILSTTVQAYFLRRIYIFSGRKRPWLWFCSLLGFLASWQFIGAIPYDYFSLGTTQLAELSTQKMVGLAVSNRACSAFVDICISISMTWLLTRRPAPRFERTRRTIYRLVLITINSGVWTAVSAILVLAPMAAMPSTLYYTMFELPIGSLYFSTLLANLNSRRYVLGDGGIWATRTIAHTQTETTSGSGSGGAGAGVEGAVRMIPVDTGRRGSRGLGLGLGFGGRAAVTVQGRRAEELEGEGRRGVLTHHDAGIMIKVDTDVQRDVDGAESELEMDDHPRMTSKGQDDYV
ncbi:uncharacterized protein STEHIDRAFT_167702 [Stereum hirsutum FP-91666 SS1]|uniref:uncharacterized protein n=1 Tax=Stereum hirsutum (strain FP-91666) TaxID=721885 RepID=UPI000440CDC1|nr:uncharacterized protein STEHIDRAFT_167702 [Stereum hirsutum FP-91666 SS1]EIM88406.1 hypothetical protein STEHIDRAFT_167702 [Stereum hirsutum FP-91666 SS1]